MPKNQPELKLISLEDVAVEPVRWLWYPYIPLGKLSIIHGDPAEGKTTLALWIAAACSRGQALPGGETGDPLTVLYQTAEDGLGDTIKPRLLESQADLHHIYTIDETDFPLSMLDERIGEAIGKTHAQLMILDPIQNRQGKKIDCSNLANVILTNHDLWIDFIRKDNPQAILDILAKEAPEGIGTVYFITLLYFISLSEYPIYDQFAKKAIDAIKTGTKPNITISYKELPDRNNSDFSKVGETLKTFKNDIKEIFGYENYKASRDIDRALWVYGHLFKDKSKSAC